MTQEQNPYQATESSTSPPAEQLPAGSLESGLNGQYDFTIGKLFKASWDLTADLSNWFTLLISIILFYAATFGISYLLGLAGLDGQQSMQAGEFQEFIGISMLTGLIALPITGPLGVGMTMMGVRRAAGLPLSVGQLFAYFPKILPIMGVGIAFTALNLLAMAPLAFVQYSRAAFAGFALSIPLTIYLTVSYMLAMPLVADKDMGPLEALETSRKAITHRFFKVLWLMIVISGFTIGFSIVTCGLGIFFALPFMIVFLGMFYRVVFGVNLSA